MIIYFKKNPEFANKYQSHKKFREMLAHELVQLLLDKRAAGDIVYGRRKSTGEARLQGKHFSESRHPLRCCANCGYNKIGKVSAQKNPQIFA